MNLHHLFPKASPAFIAANRHLFQGTNQPSVAKNGQNDSGGVLKRLPMNKTEAQFALILESQKRAGKIIRWDFEGITLRWAGDMRYTPDFCVIRFDGFLTFIEIKGGFIRSRDMVRFKGAAAYWPQFAFELWQRKNMIWTRLR